MAPGQAGFDGGLARKFEGTGLGLAMIKLLAELHGGTLAVESSVGEGSCFTVWLPLRAPEEAMHKAEKTPTTPFQALPGERIALVVEDDFKAADLIRGKSPEAQAAAAATAAA